MVDAKASSSLRIAEELDKDGVRARLMALARRRTATSADAEDLLAEALALTCDPARSPWDPSQRTFIRHVAQVMRDAAIEMARSARARREIISGDIEDTVAPIDSAPLPDDMLDEHRKSARIRHLGQRLLARISSSDPVAMAVLDLGLRGVESPSDVAERLGCRRQDVYEANRRLRIEARAIVAAERTAAEGTGQAPGGRIRAKTVA